MPRRITLTTEQYGKLIDHSVNEVINEGAWENVKYALSKLNKIGADKSNPQAIKQIKDIINRKGNEVIYNMDADINKMAPEYPNTRQSIKFLKATLLMANVYDSIVEATKLQPDNPKYLPSDAANIIISDLREYIKKFLDNDLAPIYKTMDEDNAQDLRNHLKSKRNDPNELPSDTMNKMDTTKANDKLINLATAGGLASFAHILAPIGIALIGTGLISKGLSLKGQKQSRASTLNDLYQSIRPVANATVAPTTNVPQGTPPVNASASTDKVLESLRSLFKFIVNNRKKLGNRAADNVGTGMGASKAAVKAGDQFIYNGKPVTVVQSPTSEPDKTLIRYANNTTMAVDTNKLDHKLSNLSEGKYITDKRLVQFLSKSLSFDKLNAFEELINRVEQVRNQIRNINAGEDKVLDQFIKKFKSNPIIATDFQKLFNISSDNAQAVNALKAFIDDLFITLYSGKFKFDNLIDKMDSLQEDYDKNFLRDAQDRRTFKKNLITFLTDAINLYQYLNKKKPAKTP